MDTDRYQRTERTRVRRLPERAAYDRATVHAILDEGFLCHLGFVVDGQPYVIPTGYARVGDTVLRVTGPRTPCRVFAGFLDVPDLIKRFFAAGRPGAYLAVEQPAEEHHRARL